MCLLARCHVALPGSQLFSGSRTLLGQFAGLLLLLIRCPLQPGGRAAWGGGAGPTGTGPSWEQARALCRQQTGSRTSSIHDFHHQTFLFTGSVILGLVAHLLSPQAFPLLWETFPVTNVREARERAHGPLPSIGDGPASPGRAGRRRTPGPPPAWAGAGHSSAESSERAFCSFG